MTPLLVWFLVNDRLKLLAYRIFDQTVAPLLGRNPAGTASGQT